MKNETDEIRQLLDKFMESQTSIEEEDRLREWFASHEVDDDLKDYKEMFAYFDEGMPIVTEKKPQRLRTIAIVLAAAASLTLLLMLVLHPGEDNSGSAFVAENSMTETTSVQDTIEVKDSNVEQDIQGDMEKRNIEIPKTPKNRRKPIKRVFEPLPPKHLMAAGEAVAADSAAMAQANAMAEVRLREIEIQQTITLYKLNLIDSVSRMVATQLADTEYEIVDEEVY